MLRLDNRNEMVELVEKFWEGTFNALNLWKDVNFEHVGEERYEIKFYNNNTIKFTIT